MRPILAALLAGLLNPAAAGATTVDCGFLLDVERGRWIERARITVEDGVITAVGRAGDAPADVRAGTWCLPGLIDLHVHQTAELQPQSVSWREGVTLDPADRAFRAAVYARRTLHAGFTTVRDLGASDDLNIALKRAIAGGWAEGPRMFTAGKSIATTGGHADPTNSLNAKWAAAIGAPGPTEGVVNSVDEAWQAVRQRYKDGADLIKVTATGGVLSQAASGQNAQFRAAELEAIVAAARDYGFHVAAHAHGAEGMKRAIRAGVRTIEHCTLMDDEARTLFRKHGAWCVPTLLAGREVMTLAEDPAYFSPLVLPKVREIGPRMMDTFGRAHRAGVKIAFGSDTGVSPHGENAREFAYMVEGGMNPVDAVRAATVNAAEVLGMADTLGQVKPGFAADLVAVEADPLSDITALQRVTFVMKAGAVEKSP